MIYIQEKFVFVADYTPFRPLPYVMKLLHRQIGLVQQILGSFTWTTTTTTTTTTTI